MGWYFAREIAQREHVPVGIINSSWGGTPVDAWTRIGAIGQDASLMPLFISWGKMIEDQPDALLRAKIRQRAIDDAKAQGKPVPNSPWTPDLASWGPGMLWNGMIAPLTPAAIRGAIWYQGEQNSPRGYQYRKLLPAMIADWRTLFAP